MVVQVKILVNRAEIEEAKAKNTHYARERELNKSRIRKEKVLVPDDLEVPQEDYKYSDLYLDVKDIKRARVNEIDMISIMHEGQEFNIVKTDEVLEQIKKRFTE